MATLVVQQHRSRKRSSLLQGMIVVRGRSRDGVRVGRSVELGFGVGGVTDEEGRNCSHSCVVDSRVSRMRRMM